MSAFRLWFITALTITILLGILYAAGQTILRQDANDPQIQLSEDLATSFASGQNAVSFLRPTVDVTKSLSPFVIVYDADGSIASSTAVFHDAPLSIPRGVLDSAKANGQNRVTWMPVNNLRFATIVTYFSGEHPGFVLVARSLREVEKRENQLLMVVGMGWAATLVITFIAFSFIPERQEKGKSRK